MAEYRATAFTATPQIEGPQILLQWALPTDAGSTLFRLLKKEKSFSESETDGTLLLADAVSSGTVSYVDLNPNIDTAWCYSMFVYHTATTAWTADTLIEDGETIIPTTPTGFFYVSNTRGLTGAIEPAVWPTIIGSTVQDGDIIWTCVSANPGWVVSDVSRKSAFTWDSEYIQRLLFRLPPPTYQDNDRYSDQVKLSPQQDSDNDDVWRAVHEDGETARGEFERFLLIFGSYLSKIRGAADFYPRLVDPDETLVEYLPFLAGNVGWNLSTTARTGAQRQAIMSAIPMYKIKGTITSLEPQIRQALGVLNVVVDPMSQHILFTTNAIRRTARGGTENTYSAWTAGTYARGDIVIPSSGNETGYYYQARAGGTTAGPEPTWPTTLGQDVADGANIIWRTVQFGVPHLTAAVAIHAIESFTATGTITLEAGEGDVSSQYPPGLVFTVAGSTDGLNDGIYTVLSAPSATPTVITTVETTITTQLTSPARAGPSSLSVDDTSIFTAGTTINVRGSAPREITSFLIQDRIVLDRGIGDVASQYPAGRKIIISGSTDGINDGVYTVLSSAFLSVVTVITTVEALTPQFSSPAVLPSVDEEIGILDIPDSTTLILDGTLINDYNMVDVPVVSPAFDWYDDETGFIWDIPGEESFDGIDPDRIRIDPAIVDPSELYSFAVLRIWVLPESGESVSTTELDQVDKIAEQFTPADTKVVIRIEN